MKHLSVFSLILGFGFWQIGSSLKWIDPLYYPAPYSIAQRAWFLIFEEIEFRENVLQSLKRLLQGQAIAFPLALFLALAVTIRPTVRHLTSPWIGLIYPIPKLALFPFLLIALGTGDLSKSTMIALGSFFLMYLSFELGLRRVFESEYFEIVHVYRVSKFKILWQVFLKGASPEIFSGIKMGFGYGLVLMVGSEMTMSKNGLGFYMWNAWDQFRLLDMYACLAWISFLGICSFKLCDWFELRALNRNSEIRHKD